jgi:hypothetical protein
MGMGRVTEDHGWALSGKSSDANGRGHGLVRHASAVRGLSGSGAPSGPCSRIALVLAAALALVLVYGVTVASAAAPVVAVNNASSVEYTTAHVSGEVDPQGQSTTYRFQYISEAQQLEDFEFGFPEWEFAATAKEEAIEGAAQPVEADLAGLTPGTTYHLRLVAENGEALSEAVAPSTFTTKPVAQPTVSIEAPSSITGTTTHFTGHIEPNAPAGNPAEFDVDWHFECTPECPGLSGGHIAADSSTHAVEAEATGLIPGTAYKVSLFATNFGGTATAGPESFSTATIAPQIPSEQVVPSITEATLTAQINPGGVTTYHFEYGPSASYGQSTPAATIPSGVNPVPVEARITGLSPVTGYHFRVVAENSAEKVTGTDQTFTTLARSVQSGLCPNEINRVGLSGLLPDCRAYEQVSPVNKDGNDAGAPAGEVKYAYGAPDGNAVYYGTRGPQGETHRGIQQESISRRGATGWSTESALPGGSSERINAVGYFANGSMPSTDLSKIVFSNPTSLVPANPQGGSSTGLYLADTLTQSLEWLSEPHTANPTPAPGSIEAAAFQPAGGSPDLSTVYFAAEPTLLPGEDERGAFVASRPVNEPKPWGVFEYTGGLLKAADTLPDGTLSPGGATPANTSKSQDREGVGSARGRPEEVGNQVSADGSTLYFLSPDPLAGVGGTPELYVRRNGASRLVSHSELTGRQAPSGVIAAPDLLQELAHNTAAVGSDGQAVYGAADGSIAYFQSTDQLTADAPNDNSVKMYRYEVAAGAVSYVQGVTGTIVAASEDGQRFLFADGVHIAVWDHGRILPIYEGPEFTDMRPAKATPLGSDFLFTTEAALPGFNNAPGEKMEEIYRYDVASRTTTCVSCPPAGIVPSGGAAMSSVEGTGREDGAVGGGNHVIANRGMSEDAKRVFFDTPDPLVPRDTNGKRDVYEWSEGGGTALITSGKSEEDAFFLESSANGDDVFFTTTEGLVAGDTDGEYDVYDARVDGGFQSASEVVACSGESCQEKTAAPIFETPGSVTFSEASNPVSHTVVKPKQKPLTRVQKLAKALKACHKVKSRRARVACEKKAHHAFGIAKSKPKVKSHKGGK